MKNMKYFPFERNKYFYGKLLTVDDFETEQRYINDKRRMINRFLFGTGVVCGMNVVMTDELAISVEPGLALDFSGREIVIDSPAVKRLSMLKGFDSIIKAKEEKPYLYLCLDYKEIEKEPVHNIAGANNVEHNKYQETFELSVVDREPLEELLSDRGFYERSHILYQGKGIRIRQVYPSFLQAGKEFEIKIVVENMGQPQPVCFTCDLHLECLENNGNSSMRIHFDEEDYPKSYQYEQTYILKAVQIKKAAAAMEIIEGSFELYIGGRKEEAPAGQKITMEIMDCNRKEAIMERYFNSAMEDIVKNNFQQSIYLARIFIIQTGESYLIDSIEPMPFKQYIYNNVLSDIMNQLAIKEEKRRGREKEIEKPHNPIGPVKGAEGEGKIKSGYVIMDLGIGGGAGQRFFSDDISHDLGFGNVIIILGQCEAIGDNGRVCYGSAEVFEEKTAFRAETAARINGENATFKIGLRLIEPTTNRYVRINWTAIKDLAEDRKDMEKIELFIKPEMLYLNVRESYYLEAKFKGIDPTEVNWSIREEDGGYIEPNGKYTAPNIPGIYEVIAQSSIYEKLRASIFIVVRDVEK